MPIYEYQATDENQRCEFCRERFEVFGKVSGPPLAECPKCGAPVRRLISVSSVGSSKSGLDQRAKSAGFHKLKKTGKGEYEKLY